MTAFRGGFVAWAFLMAAVLSAGRGPVAARSQTVAPSQAAPDAGYVGSAACGRCHAPIYGRWKQTRMANAVRDPKGQPRPIIPDLRPPNPRATFTQAQIA